MSAAHAESPFQDEAADAGYSADAFSIEHPAGVHMEPAEESDVFEPASEIAPGFIQGVFEANVPPPPPAADDFAKTLTMADLYANQGLIDEARDIYEDILARDPGNEMVQARLQVLEQSRPAPEPEPEPEPAPEPAPSPPVPKVKRLEGWLSKVKRPGVGGV